VINAAIKSAGQKPITTKVFIEEDVVRCHAHKELMMDWLFTEMEEHSKKLGMYSDWYDYFQRGINIEDEFSTIMKLTAASGYPELANTGAYLAAKRRGNDAASRG